MFEDHEASKHWIRERLKAFARDAAVQIEIEIASLPEGGAMLHVEGHRQHVRLLITDLTLEELCQDVTEQEQIEPKLRDLISKVPHVGDRVIVERSNGLYDVEKISEPGEVVKARQDLRTFAEAREIARGHVESGGRVWLLRQRANELERVTS